MIDTHADNAIQQAVVDAGAVSAIVAAMRAHGSDAELQHSACAALANISDGGERESTLRAVCICMVV